jgi:hypothetical protein
MCHQHAYTFFFIIALGFFLCLFLLLIRVVFTYDEGDVVAVIVWELDLQLPMQSVRILIRARCTTLCDKVCQ